MAAVLFAVGNQMSRLALRHTDSRTATLYQIGVGVLIYWLAAPFYLESWYWSAAAMPWLVAAGLIRPVLSANLGMAGTRLLGPTISSTLSATAPLFGISFGLFILGETLTWPVAFGTAGIIAGVLILSSGRAASRDWPLYALAFPIAAAGVRSITHGFAKIGLESVPDPFFVALVAYTVSLPLAAGEAVLRGGRGALAVSPGGIAPLLTMATCYAVAVLALNTALLNGELIVVSPLVACAPVFTAMLGVAVFGEDRLGLRTWIAVGLVVPSVILVGLFRG